MSPNCRIPTAAPPPPPPPAHLLPMANPYAGIVVPRAASLADADAAPPPTTTLATLLGAPRPSATHADRPAHASTNEHPQYSTAARSEHAGSNCLSEILTIRWTHFYTKFCIESRVGELFEMCKVMGNSEHL